MIRLLLWFLLFLMYHDIHDIHDSVSAHIHLSGELMTQLRFTSATMDSCHGYHRVCHLSPLSFEELMYGWLNSSVLLRLWGSKHLETLQISENMFQTLFQPPNEMVLHGATGAFQGGGPTRSMVQDGPGCSHFASAQCWYLPQLISASSVLR